MSSRYNYITIMLLSSPVTSTIGQYIFCQKVNQLGYRDIMIGWAAPLKNVNSSFHQIWSENTSNIVSYCLNNLSCSSLFIYPIVKWYLYRTVLQFLAVSWKDPANYMLWNSKLDCVWGCTNHDTAKK